MKKIILWTLGIHLITGGFLPSLVAGLTYVEFDMIREAIANAEETIEQLNKLGRLFTPWI